MPLSHQHQSQSILSRSDQESDIFLNFYPGVKGGINITTSALIRYGNLSCHCRDARQNLFPPCDDFMIMLKKDRSAESKTAQLSALGDKYVMESHSVHFGFRTVTFKGCVLFLLCSTFRHQAERSEG